MPRIRGFTLTMIRRPQKNCKNAKNHSTFRSKSCKQPHSAKIAQLCVVVDYNHTDAFKAELEDRLMSRRCELTGKGPIVKNKVSHSNVKTKAWMTPNIQKRRLFSDTLDSYVTLRVATRTIRSIEHVGGFDKFILGQDPTALSKKARSVQTRIRRSRQ